VFTTGLPNCSSRTMLSVACCRVYFTALGCKLGSAECGVLYRRCSSLAVRDGGRCDCRLIITQLAVHVRARFCQRYVCAA
jgi:hypothetical protein